MKRIAIITGILLAIVVGFRATPVVAKSLMQATENLTFVAKDTTVDGSAYLIGESVDIQGEVKGDVYCLAQTVTITGTIDGDVLCAGRSVTINGTVNGDVRAAAATVILSGVIKGSVTLAGSSVNTDSTSKIGRDATIGASETNLSGVIARDAMIGGRTVVVSGIIGRDAQVAAEIINVASTAKIGGNLSYRSENEATLPGGVVMGSVERTAPETHERSVVTMRDMLTGIFIVILMFTITTVLVTLVAPRYVHRVSNVSALKDYAFLFLIGLVSLVVAPILFVISLMTVVGIYASFVLAVVVTLGFMIGGSLVAYRLGRFMLKDSARPFMNALVGSLALGVLGSIPLVGWFVVFVSVLIGFGMVVMGMKSQYSPTTPVKRVVAKQSTNS